MKDKNKKLINKMFLIIFVVAFILYISLQLIERKLNQNINHLTKTSSLFDDQLVDKELDLLYNPSYYDYGFSYIQEENTYLISRYRNHQLDLIKYDSDMNVN